MNAMMSASSFGRVVGLSLIGFFAGGAASSAVAAEFTGVPSAHVRYGDLNLETATGLNTLYKRIVVAAYEVCQPFGHDGNDNADPLAVQQCREKIIAAAVTKIDKPALYAVYHARTSKHPAADIRTAERPN
jgi:UrcA family protein